MPTTETIVFDPPELAPGREPLGLDELGIRVDVEGADWGESTVAVQLAEQQIGSTVTRRHLDPVEMTIPLQVLEQGEVSLAEAAYRLQQKVGIAQADEYDTTWIRRDFDDGFGAAGSVAYQVHTAALQGLQGWLMAHRQHAPDVVLKVLRSPLCYATEEISSTVFKLAGGRALEWTLDEVLGSGPGLLRLRIRNTGTKAWRSIIVPIESRDHPQDAAATTTAKLTYDAAALTPKGGSVVSTSTIVNNKSGPPRVILNSQIVGTGHMTHVGPRQVLVTVKQFSGSGPARLHLRWRALGAAYWTENAPVTVPVDSAYHLVDLGEAMPERPVVGELGWEWEIVLTGSNDDVENPTKAPSWFVQLKDTFILPSEQIAIAQAPQVLRAPQSFTAFDSFDHAVGNLHGKTLPSGGTWDTTKTEGTAPGDYKTTGAGTVIKDGGPVNGYRFAVPPGGPYNTIAASVVLTWSAIPQQKDIGALGGSLLSGLRFGEAGGWIAFDHSGGGSGSPGKAAWERTALYVGGRGIEYPVKAGVSYRLTLLIIEGYAILGWVSDPTAQSLGPPTLVYPAAPPLGQKIEIGDAYVGYSTAITRTFDDFRIWEPDLDVLCHAGRSLELRTDGIHRQHLTSDVWGEVVNEGLNLYAPPSYMEGRSARGIIIPNVGDLGELPDSASGYDLEAQAFVRPAYHFAREAVGA